MASASEKLARSLDALAALQRQGQVAVRSRELGRTDRQRLLQAGFLKEVIKGWYMVSRPEHAAGDSTPWFTSFWRFCADYLNTRFGTEWSLSPEQSLLLYAGDRTVPRQLVVRSPKARNKITPLAHGTAILETRAAIPANGQARVLDDLAPGVRVFALPAAVAAVSPGFFRRHEMEVGAVLANIDTADVLPLLLDGGRTVVAGRVAGALRHVGQRQAADEILAAMRGAGFDVRENNPFAALPAPAVKPSEQPWVVHMRARWQAMRGVAMEGLAPPPGLPGDASILMRAIDEAHADDAYHSLSIEGYRVTRGLIERVRSGAWDPEAELADAALRDAWAARGYYECFEAVKRTIADICAGKNPGTAFRDDLGTWYRALLAPSVRAGLVAVGDLAGFRSNQVFIRGSRHIPPHHAAVRDLMPALFDLLETEQNAGARAVLGHFMFVFIHPYMDGNGRLGRFLMNAMLASGGYAWCVVPVGWRNSYMQALETASVDGDIGPFARLVGTLARPLDVPP